MDCSKGKLTAEQLMSWEEVRRTDFNEAAEDAYRQIADETGYRLESVHSMPLCHWVNDHMQAILIARGYNIDHQIVMAGSIRHSYLVAHTEMGEIIIEPTWQQFFYESRLEFPKVLTGTREEVAEAAKVAGIDERYLDLWNQTSVKFIKAFDYKG